MNRRSLLFVLLAFALWGISCKDIGETWTPPRIAPEAGIVDGVKLGDSRTAVLTKLGAPAAEGAADGMTKDGAPVSWFTNSYFDGSHAGLTLFYLETSGGYGPLVVFWIEAPYTGKTLGGLGIGSSRSEVQRVYGEPYATSSPAPPYDSWDRYHFGSYSITFSYQDQKSVSRISLVQAN